MTEQWRPIPQWEGRYEVSDLGRVRSVARKTWCPRGGGFWRAVPDLVLRTSTSRGYHRVTLQNNGRTTVQVHRLVLLAFVGPCPDGMEGCHNDGDKNNNALTNLRWDTSSANHLDRTAHGGNHNARKTHCPAGHPYTPENTYTVGRERKCRTCVIRRVVERKRRIRTARKADA